MLTTAHIHNFGQKKSVEGSIHKINMFLRLKRQEGIVTLFPSTEGSIKHGGLQPGL